MEFTIRLFTAVIFWTSFNVICCSNPSDICPRRSGDTWRVDEKDGESRCILSCSDGYVPSGCHVIRPRPGGRYNKPIPICEEAPSIVAAGFRAAGVAVGSMASWLWGSTTVAGGLYAGLQSAGAAGLAGTTKIILGGLGYTVSDYVMKVFTDCERE